MEHASEIPSAADNDASPLLPTDASPRDTRSPLGATGGSKKEMMATKASKGPSKSRSLKKGTGSSSDDDDSELYDSIDSLTEPMTAGAKSKASSVALLKLKE